jgi:hypothetical protein
MTKRNCISTRYLHHHAQALCPGETTAAVLWIKYSAGHAVGTGRMTNEKIPDPTGNEGMFADPVSNYLTGCVSATCTGS